MCALLSDILHTSLGLSPSKDPRPIRIQAWMVYRWHLLAEVCILYGDAAVTIRDERIAGSKYEWQSGRKSRLTAYSKNTRHEAFLPSPGLQLPPTASSLHTLITMSTPPATKSVASEDIISKKVRSDHRHSSSPR